MCRSVLQTAQASTRMSTSFPLGSGSENSKSIRGLFSIRPDRRKTAAFMVFCSIEFSGKEPPEATCRPNSLLSGFSRYLLHWDGRRGECSFFLGHFRGEWLNGRALAWGARDSGFNSRLPE